MTNKHFQEVVKGIYTKSGIRSLLLKADYFGKKDSVDFVVKTKNEVHTLGIGKEIFYTDELMSVSGLEAKNICLEYARNRILKELKKQNATKHKEKQMTINKLEELSVVKLNELLTSLGITND